MKKVRAYITVDLNVADNLTFGQIAEMVCVGKYVEKLYQGERILPKDEDFEVEDYVNIKVKDHKDISFIKP